MSSLQIGLVIAGVALVIAVLLYNRWQERRVRGRLAAARNNAVDERATARVEPTLKLADADAAPVTTRGNVGAASNGRSDVSLSHDASWQPPMDEVVRLSDDDSDEAVAREPAAVGVADTVRTPRAPIPAQFSAAAPDPDIETIVTIKPDRAVTANALAAGLHARVGKTVRWYGRRDPNGPWQRLASDSRGEYGEVAGCMLLADRNGAATLTQIETFRKVASDIAATLPGTLGGPSPDDEAQRAETLDRLCAELDMQIGLTVRKVAPAIIAGTRLRGVAEAAGFRLAPTGRFEWVQDDTGVVLFTLQSMTDEAFTPDALRAGSTPGVVFLLDVPRVADPAKAFDQMKLAARRMSHTLGGELVDDNGRPLNDAGLAAIRTQVAAAEVALKRYNIEPGSPRALKLFAA
ncbi:MAG TPA: cell division protein ZipA C-terminal FtsZ-binding domain-containing protein [Casimicrobiaceae bacterium]|nr:cell division protein ZipA C-terminal FtsZ-binding domain-containing protein [Casimicrobiaceae bacterium]